MNVLFGQLSWLDLPFGTTVMICGRRNAAANRASCAVTKSETPITKVKVLNIRIFRDFQIFFN